MATVNEQFSDLHKAAVDAAVRFARVSVDSAERMFTLNVETAKTSLDDAAKNLMAISSVKDVQELNALRAKLAEASLEQSMAYSRNIYELATSTQAEMTALMEERMADLQRGMVDGLDKVAKTAPAGSDIALAAMKSNLAAATAAMDSITKAAKQVASYSDASFKAAASGAAKTVATATGKRAK